MATVVGRIVCYGQGLWLHFCFVGHSIWPQFDFVAKVFGHVLFSWPRYLATFCCYGHGIRPCVLMATVVGRIVCYGQGLWLHFCFVGHSIWPQFDFVAKAFGCILFLWLW